MPKGQLNKTWKYLVIITLFSLIGLNTISITEALTVEEIQRNIDIANKNREALEKEIEKYQSELKVISTEANTLQSTIKSLDVSTNKLTSEVKLTENNIQKTNYTIADTGLEINDKNKQITTGNQALKEAVRKINELDNLSIWEILLSKNDISDFWTDVEQVVKVQAEINDQVRTVTQIKNDLEKAKQNLEFKKAELEEYTAELTDKKKVLLVTKEQKSNLLTVTKNTEANYQKILQDKVALKAALDKEVAEFENQLRLTVDPGSFPRAGKGILAWPLDNIRITQNFGKTSDSGRLYASGTHNGTDFGASIGTRVKSSGNGVVEGVGDTDTVCPNASFGKWIFIRYDNGLASTFAHLSVISVTPGQRVATGEVVGYSGNTGYSTGPHLHMTVYAGQGVKISSLKSLVCQGTYTVPLADPKAYLDPLAYL